VTDPKFLPAFSGWLHALGEDVLSLAHLLGLPEAAVPVRLAAAQGLHGLLRLVELVPEDIEALGYLEGAFAVRVIAERALAERPEPAAEAAVEPAAEAAVEPAAEAAVEPAAEAAVEPAAEAAVEPAAEGRVPRLAADAALVAEFLGDDLPRFREIWLSPAASTRAGRAASDLLVDEALRHDVQREAREWAEHYHAPELGEGPEELVKVEAFFRTRLRRGE
jgi:hypothetical protein